MLKLKNCRLFDGSGNAVIEHAALLIQNGFIRHVGFESDCEEAETEIDLYGATVLPGFTDAHIHFGSLQDGRLCGADKTNGFQSAIEQLLDWGVTSIRSAGDFEGDLLALEGDRRRYAKPIPRIAVSGRAFQAEGGHPAVDCYGNDTEVNEHALYFPKSIIDAKQEVERQAKAGVHHVKIFLANEHSMNGSPIPMPDWETVAAITDAAHAHGLPVMVHCQQPSFALMALHCGADSIEHLICGGHEGDEITQELIEAFLKNDAWLVPTLTVPACLGMPKDSFQKQMQAVLKLYRAGVKLAVGTDTGVPGVPFGKAVHLEMALLCEAGISNKDALLAATANGGAVCGTDCGLLAAGRPADLVAVEGDPLKDIHCTQNIRLVMLDGNICRNNL